MAAFDQRYFTAPSLPGIHIFGSCGSRNSHARTVSHAASGYRDQRVTAWLLRVFLSRTGLYAVVLLLAVLSLTTTNNLYDDERGDSPHNFSTASVGSTFSRVESGVLFREKPLVLWTSDFHIATIRDIQDLMKPMGVSFIDRSLTPRCHFHDNCANSSNLKVITRSNGLNLEAPLIDEFYNVYKDDPLIKTVDAFVCYHPTAMCQLYKPFDKSLVVMASTRFELGRFEPDRWQQWIDDLIEIAADPKSFVGANNEYDANYIQYFTGLKVPVIPSYCGYTEASYNPIKPGFLTFAGRNPPSYHHKFFRKEYEATFRRRNSSEDLQFKHFRSVYNTFEFQDLANHQGVIFVPYQVSIMTIFELYRMNIPLFFPSFPLLCEWQSEYLVVKERTFHAFRFKERSRRSELPPHPSQTHIPDPNDDYDMDSIRYWFQFADFYKGLPHIIHFDSVDDLFDKLLSTNLTAVSTRMKAFNIKAKKDISAQWREVLLKIAKHSPNHPM